MWVRSSVCEYNVDHCPCFTTCKSHCTTTYNNTPCFVNAARTCLSSVCLLALLCPCAFFGCDLLACMGHLIFFFSVLVSRRKYAGATLCEHYQVRHESPLHHKTLQPAPSGPSHKWHDQLGKGTTKRGGTRQSMCHSVLQVSQRSIFVYLYPFSLFFSF